MTAAHGSPVSERRLLLSIMEQAAVGESRPLPGRCCLPPIPQSSMALAKAFRLTQYGCLCYSLSMAVIRRVVQAGSVWLTALMMLVAALHTSPAAAPMGGSSPSVSISSPATMLAAVAMAARTRPLTAPVAPRPPKKAAAKPIREGLPKAPALIPNMRRRGARRSPWRLRLRSLGPPPKSSASPSRCSSPQSTPACAPRGSSPAIRSWP